MAGPDGPCADAQTVVSADAQTVVSADAQTVVSADAQTVVSTELIRLSTSAAVGSDG